MTSTVVLECRTGEEKFTREQVSQWRKMVTEERELLFRRNWKNARPVLGLRSREEEAAFRYVLEWYEEFSDVVGRQKQRERMDKLIAMGRDVNAPNEDVKF